MFWVKSFKGGGGGGGGGSVQEVVAHGGSTVYLLNISVDGGKLTCFKPLASKI